MADSPQRLTAPAAAGGDGKPPFRHGVTMLEVALVGLLVASGILNYIDRQAVAALAPTLKARFGMNNEAWGWINSSFSLVYIFTTSFGGAWMDRIGIRRGLLISTAIWTLAAAGHALAAGFASLCLWRALLATGEGPGMSALLKGIRRLLPPQLRDTGTALIGAGSIAGALIAPLVVIPLAERFTWRAAFLVSAGFSLLWLPLWAMLAFRPQANLGPEPAAPQASSVHHGDRLRLRSCALWATLIAIFFAIPPTVFVQNFLALYLNQTYHVSQLHLKSYLWQPFLATDLGQIVGGVGVSVLVRRGWTFLGARRLLVAGGFLGAMSLLWMIEAGDAASAVWRLNLSRFAFQAAYTALLVYGIESAPEGQAALMSGLMNAAFSACNFLFNPLIGAMVDRYHGYGPVLIMVGLSPLGGMAAWVVLTARPARGKEFHPAIITTLKERIARQSKRGA